MARPSNRAQRRAQIVEGMMRAVARWGYEGASIQRVAQEAGLGHGLVHHHFEDKQAIVSALLEALAQRQEERFWRALALKAPGADAASDDAAVMAYIEAHVGLEEGVDEQALACWVAISERARCCEELSGPYQAIVARSIGRLEELLRAWLGEQASAEQVRVGAATIYAAIQGAYMVGVGCPQVVPRGFAATGIKAMAQGWAAQVKRCGESSDTSGGPQG